MCTHALPHHNVTKVLLQPTACTFKGHSATSLPTINTHGVSILDMHNKVALKPQQNPHLFVYLPRTRCSTDAEHNTSPQFFHWIFVVLGLPTKYVHLHPTKIATLPTHAHKSSPLALPTLNLKICPQIPFLTTRTFLPCPQNSAITYFMLQSHWGYTPYAPLPKICTPYTPINIPCITYSASRLFHLRSSHDHH